MIQEQERSGPDMRAVQGWYYCGRAGTRGGSEYGHIFVADSVTPSAAALGGANNGCRECGRELG